ncbi:sorbosone dehydrogenase family protein [Arthrobacter sp. MSA 4-2]|uniref:PQQ-dependent sugar dehydrogenase n=1 Tax=Arthrobacter sp. MSA 4-2 TaxID=2794349 RepID=UPI001E51128F|nr:PQQ-dependent sugar dehydrogenase [Arthrobacter sp. MSA 4-2]
MKIMDMATRLVACLTTGVFLTSCAGTGDSPAPAASAGPAAPASTVSPAPATTAGPAAEPGQTTDSEGPRVVTDGLEAPWSVVLLDGVALVSERDSSRILEVSADGAQRVAATIEGVTGTGEGGLLGLAVDAERRLYVYSTAADGNRIQRFPITGAPGALGLGEAETLLTGIPAARNHDGGRIAFGPDGMLYATTGDAGQPDVAQDRTSLGGKILRMEADGSVPEDNPFPGSLVYSYGHRNPQGLTWDDAGTLYAAEFGQNTWDELNVITPGSNYGWPLVEGIAGSEEFTDPVQQWTPETASPSGITHLNGTIYIANLRGRVLRAVPVEDPSTSTELYAGDYGRIRDVIPGPENTLWILTSNTDGRGRPGADDDRLISIPPELP